jgi:hypothetical protein
MLGRSARIPPAKLLETAWLTYFMVVDYQIPPPD